MNICIGESAKKIVHFGTLIGTLAHHLSDTTNLLSIAQQDVAGESP